MGSVERKYIEYPSELQDKQYDAILTLSRQIDWHTNHYPTQRSPTDWLRYVLRHLRYRLSGTKSCNQRAAKSVRHKYYARF